MQKLSIKGAIAGVSALFFSLACFLLFSNPESSHAWSAPTEAENDELAACYSTVQRGYDNFQRTYWTHYLDKVDWTDTEEEFVLNAIALIYTGASIALPSPWSTAAAIQGDISQQQVTRYYDGVRQGHHFYYQWRIKTVEIAADAAVAECENQYLNYGDPENQEENQFTDPNRGTSIPGGTQIIGGSPRGTVHVDGPL